MQLNHQYREKQDHHQRHFGHQRSLGPCTCFRHSTYLNLVARRQSRIERRDAGLKLADHSFRLNAWRHIRLNRQGRQTIAATDKGKLLAVFDRSHLHQRNSRVRPEAEFAMFLDCRETAFPALVRASQRRSGEFRPEFVLLLRPKKYCQAPAPMLDELSFNNLA